MVTSEERKELICFVRFSIIGFETRTPIVPLISNPKGLSIYLHKFQADHFVPAIHSSGSMKETFRVSFDRPGSQPFNGGNLSYLDTCRRGMGLLCGCY
jgi:hypothetical protein